MPNTQTAERRKPKAGPAGATRRRTCSFCKEKIDEIDFKDYTTLRRSMTEKGRIRASRITGTCRRHQQQLGPAVKRAREMGLLPYVAR